jgi:hypothetical protein
MFEVADGRRIGFPDEDFDETSVLHQATLKVHSEIDLGEEFAFVFDLGDEWRHRCTVAAAKVDPVAAYGTWPDRPVPARGWGWIPDQYGRRSESEDGADRPEPA